MTKERNSNFELLRIVSMFCIVFYHLLIHGLYNDGYISSDIIQTPIVNTICRAIMIFTLFHVNSFVMVTGYFQCEGKFKKKKIIDLAIQTLFYTFLLFIVFNIYGVFDFSTGDVIKEFVPFGIYSYWFVRHYIVLYLLSPFINILIDNLDKKKHLKLLIICFITFSLLPYLTNGLFVENSGYNFFNFVFIYLIGAYFKKYPINIKNKFKFRLSMIGIFLIAFILNVCSYFIFTDYEINNGVINLLRNNISNYCTCYSNPLIIIQTIAYFLFFYSLDIKNKFINFVSSLTFGIYLISDNNWSRSIIYNYMNLNNSLVYSRRYVLYLLLLAICIFVFCAIIEFIRQELFKNIKFLYNKIININKASS